MTRGYNAKRLRAGLRAIRIEQVVRVIHCAHRGTPLVAVPTPSRFSDPHARYAAETVRCAFWETLGRNRFTRRRRRELPRADAESALVVSVVCDDPLALIDLRGDGPVRIGAPSAVAHDGNHAAGRALSGAVHGTVPEADGFVFLSRFTGDRCVAVFERSFAKLRAAGIVELVQHAEFLEALDDYDIVLTGPPAHGG